MKPEQGAPAFDNIDELLAEKIVTHGRAHADFNNTRTSDPSPDPHRIVQRKPFRTIMAAAAAIGVVIYIVYYYFRRKPNR